MLRWLELLGAMPEPQAAALVNRLALAFGFTALAARRAARLGSLTAVERAVAMAHDALARCLTDLPPPFAVTTTEQRVPQPPVLPERAWGAATDAQAAREDAQRAAFLLAAVQSSRRAADNIAADEPAVLILADLQAAQRALAGLHDHLRSLDAP